MDGQPPDWAFAATLPPRTLLQERWLQGAGGNAVAGEGLESAGRKSDVLEPGKYIPFMCGSKSCTGSVSTSIQRLGCRPR